MKNTILLVAAVIGAVYVAKKYRKAPVPATAPVVVATAPTAVVTLPAATATTPPVTVVAGLGDGDYYQTGGKGALSRYGNAHASNPAFNQGGVRVYR